MIINLWSTPRTGSNWYTSYLYNQYNRSIRYHNSILVLNQFFNTFHLKSYMIENYSDFIYEYQKDASYNHYYLDVNKRISIKNIYKQRNLDLEHEEDYRLSLLDFKNLDHKCFIFHSHVMPMSKKSYNFLRDNATKNIFLYRENIINQLSSYAIGFHTKNFHKPNNQLSDIDVEEDVLKNLADRIIYWHKLDKNDCEIVKYEDLPFDKVKNLPSKQNSYDTFSALSDTTKQTVIKLDTYIRNSI
ncbi:MAG: hypothetical protein EB127_13435 [Alphaproteobacteria bacterium]|nr:hypothetical protein [Alphaproteobacteria bacterium]